MICHLTTSYPTLRVPYAGHFIESLASAQAATSLQVRIIAPKASRPVQTIEPMTFEAPPGMDTPGGLKGLLEKAPLSQLGSAPRLFQQMLHGVIRHARTADVLHAHWLVPSGLIAVTARAFLGLPVVITARGSDVELVEKLPQSTAVLFKDIPVAAVSSSLAKRLRILGLRRVRVIEQPIAAPGHQPFPWENRNPNKLLFVGSLVPGKCPSLAINLVSRIPEVTLDIVGDGPERHSLEQLVDQRNLNSRVCFHGAVPPSQIPRFHGTAGAFLSTSLREGRPNALLEAISYGTPVISSAIDGVMGLGPVADFLHLFEPGSLENLESLVRGHLRNLPLSRQMTQKAWETLKLPTWQETVENYNELYRSAQATTS